MALLAIWVYFIFLWIILFSVLLNNSKPNIQSSSKIKRGSVTFGLGTCIVGAQSK